MTDPRPARESGPDPRPEPVSLVSFVSTTEERNARSEEIDRLAPRELVELILGEDARVAQAVQEHSAQIARLVDVCAGAIADGGTVHYVGAGTSGRLGVLDAVELLPTFRAGADMFTAHLAGGPEAMMRAVEGAEDDEAAGAELVRTGTGLRDVVIGLAASGRTPFVGGALAAAREKGLATALVAANPAAPLASAVDLAILLDVGPEVVTGSTRMKAATAQKMTLNALSTAVMVRLGKTYSNLMIDVLPTNEKLVARTVRMLVQATGADPQRAAEVLTEAEGSVRVALIALLAGSGVAEAASAAQRHPRDPHRAQDPAGIRTAVESLR